MYSETEKRKEKKRKEKTFKKMADLRNSKVNDLIKTARDGALMLTFFNRVKSRLCGLANIYMSLEFLCSNEYFGASYFLLCAIPHGFSPGKNLREENLRPMVVFGQAGSRLMMPVFGFSSCLGLWKHSIKTYQEMNRNMLIFQRVPWIAVSLAIIGGMVFLHDVWELCNQAKFLFPKMSVC
jgi:hypothetical protein